MKKNNTQKIVLKNSYIQESSAHRFEAMDIK